MIRVGLTDDGVVIFPTGYRASDDPTHLGDPDEDLDPREEVVIEEDDTDDEDPEIDVELEEDEPEELV